ncbi:MAG: SPOR domain-containing protein [Candidatus Methylomirabilales bacterium]
MAKRLVIYGVVGIVIVGAFYWYTHFYRVAPSPPSRVARPNVPARPVPSPVRPKAVKSPIRPNVPTPSPSKVKSGVIAKPAKPTQTVTSAKKSAPKAVAMVVEPKVTGEKRFTVQVASLVVERNALSLRTRLAKLGYNPLIRKKTARITRHRVFGGEFGSPQEAEELARRLNVDGFPSNLVRIGNGRVALEVGWSYSLNDAIDMARNLQKKEYTPKIVSKVDPTTVHTVRVGGYEHRSEALEVVEALREEGFSAIVVRY